MPQAGNNEIKNKSITENKLADSTKIAINQMVYPIVEATGNNNYIGATTRITKLEKGLTRLTLFVSVDATGNCSLNLNEYGVKNIKDSFGNVVNNLKKDIPYNLCYNGSDFILQGKGGGGNATAPQILKNATATVDNGPIVGTMEERGTVNKNLNCGETYNLTEGHYNNSIIKANDLASQTPANATEAQILAGYNAWVNGLLVNGNAKSSIYKTIEYNNNKAGNVIDLSALGFVPDIIICKLVVYSYDYNHDSAALGFCNVLNPAQFDKTEQIGIGYEQNFSGSQMSNVSNGIWYNSDTKSINLGTHIVGFSGFIIAIKN